MAPAHPKVRPSHGGNNKNRKVAKRLAHIFSDTPFQGRSLSSCVRAECLADVALCCRRPAAKEAQDPPDNRRDLRLCGIPLDVTAQQRVRMKWGNIIQMYKGIMPLLQCGFENKTAGVSDYNMFVKVKM